MLTCQKDLFSLPDDLHYLNCAYMAPLARPVEEAGIAGIERKRNPALVTPEDFFTESNGVRERFARLIGAHDLERIAILPSVSYGIAIAARNIELRPSQNVVVLAEQFPSNYYAWSRRCRETGAELRVVAAPETSERGAGWNEALLEAIDASTAAVAMAEAHWSDGTWFDLAAVRTRTREVGAALVVDGTQTLGALPFSLAQVEPDALVCAGYKTLLGPYSIALAYFGERFDDGSPLEDNWLARTGSEDFAGLVDYSEQYRPAAGRYDVGERSNLVLLPMMARALDLVLEFTPEAIQEYCRAITEPALAQLRELGYWVESPTWRTANIFGIRPPQGVDPLALRDLLAQRRIIVAVRGSAVRVSPSVYNRESDLEALRSALTEVLA